MPGYEQQDNLTREFAMNTIERLQAALDAARELGYEVRAEHLDGQVGGACEVHGRKQLFIDVSLAPREQLEQALESLADDQRAPRRARGIARKTPSRAA